MTLDAPTAEEAATAYAPVEDEARQQQAGRSLWLNAFVNAVKRPTAQVGLVWVGLLFFVAVFAPLLANSRPLLAKTAEGWTSPAWQGLTAVDIALPLFAFGVLVLLIVRRFVKMPPASFVPLVLGILGLSFLAGVLVADPPRIEQYSRYRLLAENGTYERVLLAPIPYSPNDTLRDLGRARTAAPWWAPNDNARQLQSKHWLGTTINSEDMASRMIHATRVALAIGFVATGISSFIGILIGAVMGYAGGVVDLALMRLVEIVQAIPVLIVLLIVMTLYGKNIWLMMATIGVMSWTADARFIRAEFLRLRGQEFVQAGRAAGLPTWSLLFRHMLPNGIAPVLVNASFGVASAILLESTLSFLNVGLEAKDPSWGALLNQARSGGSGFNWWIATFPGLAIFLTVFAYILIGESLRDALDPKLKKAG
jgi:peptide/nickel transport system permease protein